MLIILATDIFGLTSHVQEVTAHLWDRGHVPVIISPFSLSRSFSDEAEAYAAFLQKGGVDAYTEKILAGLQVAAEPLICIGFSAGAASLWRALSQPEVGRARLAILFYGAQIRDAAELQPLCETLLVFPAEEPHFSVAGLVGRLQGRPGVCCTQVVWLHGYMNRLSRNFDPEGYRRTMAWLDGLLDRPDREGETGDVFGPLVNTGS